MQFKISFHLSKDADIIWLNVKCTIVTTNRVIESLLEECIKINKDKIVSLHQ